MPDQVDEALMCERDGCGNAVLPLEEPRGDEPSRMTRQARKAAGLRTECWTHHKETHGLTGRYMFHPGQPPEKVS